MGSETSKGVTAKHQNPHCFVGQACSNFNQVSEYLQRERLMNVAIVIPISLNNFPFSMRNIRHREREKSKIRAHTYDSHIRENSRRLSEIGSAQAGSTGSAPASPQRMELHLRPD